MVRWLLIIAAFALSRNFGHAQNPAGKDICHGDECYPAIFTPTSEFAIVHDDQSIPPGLRVRINMQTGVKEARLLLPEERDKEGEENNLALVPGEDAHEGTVITTDTALKPFPPTKPLPGADRSAFGEALARLDNENTCSTLVEEALDLLEDFAHELEFGLKIVESLSSKSLERLLYFMQSHSAQCRQKASLVLGSALRNNENAILALPHGLSLQTRLLSMIRTETDETAKKMMIYTLSSTMAQKHAKQEYAAGDGHQVLHHIYESASEELRAKIASFLEDHFTSIEEVPKISLQHGTNYQKHLADIDALERWCNTFQVSLLGHITNSIAREKILSAVSQIKRSNMDTCNADAVFLSYLAKESLGETTESTDALVALARSARSLFGNIKASRKHGVAYL